MQAPSVSPGRERGLGADRKRYANLWTINMIRPPLTDQSPTLRHTGSPTEEAEARVGEALQSVEEAMRDLLIAADLVHVIRGGPGGSGSASFIGQDKVADTASLLMAARGMQQVGGVYVVCVRVFV